MSLCKRYMMREDEAIRAVCLSFRQYAKQSYLYTQKSTKPPQFLHGDSGGLDEVLEHKNCESGGSTSRNFLPGYRQVKTEL